MPSNRVLRHIASKGPCPEVHDENYMSFKPFLREPPDPSQAQESYHNFKNGQHEAFLVSSTFFNVIVSHGYLESIVCFFCFFTLMTDIRFYFVQCLACTKKLACVWQCVFSTFEHSQTKNMVQFNFFSSEIYFCWGQVGKFYDVLLTLDTPPPVCPLPSGLMVRLKC